MKKITTTIICLMTAFSIYAQSDFTTNLLFVAKLSGDQVVPPVTTTALGEASFALNPTHDTLCVNLSAKGLSGPMIGVSLYEGHIGGTGTLVVDLSAFINGNRMSTVITGSMLNNLFVTNLLNGDYFITITTANNPAGEIRGQVELESDYPFLCSLDGNGMNPPVSTTGMGLVTFDLSRSMRSLRIRGAFENLSSNITAVVLEREVTGQPTVVVYDLTSNLSGNTINADIDPDTFAVDILRGNVYMRINTVNNVPGEIRGALVKQRTLTFDARIEGSQQVPPVPTTAMGTGMISFNASMDTMWYNFMLSGLSGPLSSIELFTGAPGATGTLAIDLSSGMVGNRVQGYVNGPNIPTTYINDLLVGNAYISASTMANPAGEIRGQLLRFAREGFTFTIDAMQETPPTSSAAIGSGIASIDRDADNLHFRMIVSNLSGPITSAHFHNAPVGQPGLVIFDLAPYFTMTGTDDGAFNYWMRSAGFDSSKVYLFLNNQVYVNIHTAAFPNGEIRGQVLKGSSCNNISNGITAAKPLALDFSVYPNPFSNDEVNISFSGLVNGKGDVRIYDMSGSLVDEMRTTVWKGINSLSVPASVQAGIYMMEISVDGEKQFQTRLIKQ